MIKDEIYSVAPEERILIETFMGDNFYLSKDWNGLMPVIRKIREYTIAKLPFGDEYYQAICNALLEVNIAEAYYEVIEFIKHKTKVYG